MLVICAGILSRSYLIPETETQKFVLMNDLAHETAGTKYEPISTYI